MFNLQGSEIIFILLIALVVLGPEKLPGAIRRATSMYTELRKLSSGFQDEFKTALDEPLREMKSTADLVKNAADPKRIADTAEREAELAAAAEKKARQAADTTAAMEAAGAAHLAQAEANPTSDPENDARTETEASVDAFADPVDDPPDAEPEPGRAADADDDEAPTALRLAAVDLGNTDAEESYASDAVSDDADGDEPEERSA